MKTLIVLIFLISASILNSQTREPIQQNFTWSYFNGTTTATTTATVSSANDYFKLNNFMLGYMWGGERKISQSLSMTQADPTTAFGVWNSTETRTD
jgi:hypothetical protein